MVVYEVSPPCESKTGVVVVYDVHGFSGGRIKSVCDSLSACGHHVCMPDIYGGEEGVNDHGGFGSETGMAFLKSFPASVTNERIGRAVGALRGKGCEKIGVVGFCWGVWAGWQYACLPDAGGVDAVVGPHPSIRVGGMLFGENEVEDLGEKVDGSCAYMLMPAGNDPDQYREGGAVVEAVRGRGIVCDVLEFPEMAHGWVPRGDVGEEGVGKGVEDALGACVEFFGRYLRTSDE